MDKEFSRKIIFMNFLYSIIMVCYHADAGVHFSDIIQTGIWDKIAHEVNQLFIDSNGTYFFMMLAAFLLYRDMTEDNIRSKWHRRVKTLLIPWLIWNLIGMISYHDFDKGIVYLLRNFITSRFCGQLWFVEALWFFLLFIPLFRRIFRMKYVSEIVLAIVFVGIYLCVLFLRGADFFPSEISRSEVIRVIAHVPAYCLGTYLGLNHAEFVMSEEYNSRHRIASLVIAGIVLILPYVFSDNFIGYTFGTLKCIGVWLIFSKKYFTFEPKWWMQISFYTYAIHNFVLYWEGKIIKMSGWFSFEFSSSTVTESFALLWRLSLSAIAVILITISAKILIRFAPKFYELLAGGRVPKEA